MQYRVEHSVGPLKVIFRAGLDLLNNGVTVALALREQREDQRLGRGSHEFLWYHGANIHSDAMYVNGFLANERRDRADRDTPRLTRAEALHAARQTTGI